MPRSRRHSKNWKRTLGLAAGMIVLLSLLAVFEVAVLMPKRLESERQARREAPAQLIAPSQRPPGEPEPERITAFRIGDWRLQPDPEEVPDPLAWKGDAADVYLGGYLTVMEGQKLVESGDLAAAREKYEQAAKVFAMIHERQPDFEPGMVEFRQRKIAEKLAKLVEAMSGQPPSDLSDHPFEFVRPGL